jgi:MoaA/NifB/PqqE/SkfB family radical SAM enzyme
MGTVDSKSFCVLPWIHMNLNPDGAATLCCYSPAHPIFDEVGTPLNAQTHRLEDIWNSSAMKDIRRRMSAGEELPHCNGCFHNEKHTGASYRTQSRARWLDGDPALATAIENAADWTAPQAPLSFDLRLGNLCNLKCTACKPLYSSQIERDPVHSAWVDGAPYLRFPSRFDGTGDWSQAEGLVGEIMDLSANLKWIQLAGGEPTINKTQMGWLRRLREEGRAADIDLQVFTNLSNVHPEVFEIFRAFKSLAVDLSIDGHGPMYEYVRFPGKWGTLTRNVTKLREVRPDARLSINCVLQAINAFNVIDLLSWAQDEGIRIVVSIGRGLDRYNDFRILPPALQREARAKVNEYLMRQSNRDIAELRLVMDNVFDEMGATDFTDEQRRIAIVGLMQFVNDLDRSRGISFAKVAPEIIAGVISYHGGWDPALRHSAA